MSQARDITHGNFGGQPKQRLVQRSSTGDEVSVASYAVSYGIREHSHDNAPHYDGGAEGGGCDNEESRKVGGAQGVAGEGGGGEGKGIGGDNEGGR